MGVSENHLTHLRANLLYLVRHSCLLHFEDVVALTRFTDAEQFTRFQVLLNILQVFVQLQCALLEELAPSLHYLDHLVSALCGHDLDNVLPRYPVAGHTRYGLSRVDGGGFTWIFFCQHILTDPLEARLHAELHSLERLRHVAVRRESAQTSAALGAEVAEGALLVVATSLLLEVIVVGVVCALGRILIL